MEVTPISQYDSALEQKWGPVLEGIDSDYTRKVTATLLENQAKCILSEQSDRMDENSTTVGKLGTFQKFAFPLVRRVYPDLIANSIVGVQPMKGPVSQIFYLGHTRAYGAQSVSQTVYSKYNLTYRGQTSSPIMAGTTDASGGARVGTTSNSTNTSAMFNLDGTLANVNQGHVLSGNEGGVSTTFGGQIAAFPVSSTILGYSVSAGEVLAGNQIPEINFHIEQQAVVSRTRKMRALWTLEAAQDLRAYHNLNLEGELTSLLSKELSLEIDRELIEDLRMIAYDPDSVTGWEKASLDMGNSNNFQGTGSLHPDASQTGTAGGDLGIFTPAAYQYQFANAPGDTAGAFSNVFAVDLTSSAFGGTAYAPQHVGHIYANLLATINYAAQDIYKTTLRGPGSWILTSPLVASMLESASKLEGGIVRDDAPTNIGKNAIQFKGKFMGRYDLYVDPLYPDDEMMIGYKGSNAMDAGYVYAPYIPLQQLPTITDPETFQPRKGILTRYGKAAVAPAERFYRIIRLVGPTANFLYSPFIRSAGVS